jgi:hypothetical protein
MKTHGLVLFEHARGWGEETANQTGLIRGCIIGLNAGLINTAL